MSTIQNKPGQFWLRCGECLHFVKTDGMNNTYWCINSRCKQAAEILLVVNAGYENQAVSREVA